MMTEERSDFSFRTSLRNLTPNYFRDLATKFQCAIFNSDKRVTVFSSARNIEIMAQIMRKLDDPKLERVVIRASNSRNLRARIAAYRSEFTTQLGAAVVSSDTVLFYPSEVLRHPNLPNDRLSFKIDLAKMPKRVETALRNELGQAGFVKLLSYHPALKGFTFAKSRAEFSVTGQRGDDFIQVAAMSAKSLKIRVDLDVDASLENLAGGEWVDSFCDLFQAKARSIEVLHAFANDVNSLSLSRNFWQPNALGLLDLRSELLSDVVNQALSPKVSVSI